MNFLFIGAIFLVMYFFFLRPAQTRTKREQKKFLESIQKGDKIVTVGGVHGRIIKLNDDDTMLIEVDTNTKLKIEKSSLSVEFSKKVEKKK